MITVKDKSYIALHGDRCLHVKAEAHDGSGTVVIDVFGPKGHINFRLETSTWCDELRPLRDLLNTMELTAEVTPR